jgi:hypothetical protein
MYVSRAGFGAKLYDSDDCPKYFCRDMDWMKVARVCRYWRAVALQCPMLWAHLCLSDYHLTRKMLRRSQNLPIYVVGDLSHPHSSRVTKAAYVALEHLSRIQALHICAPYTRMRGFFSKMIGPAPLLESLYVTTYDRDEYGFTLPAHMFRGNFPRLRRIYLNRCNLDWDSPQFSNLTHLEVYGSPTPKFVDMSVLLDVLRTIHFLNTLCLEKCDIHSAGTVSSTEPLVMDHLAHLHLDSFAFGLLWHIKFCALASLKLDSPDMHSLAELSRLLDIITSHFDGMSNAQLFRTLMVEAGHSFIHMRGWTTVYWHSLHRVIAEPVQLDLAISWNDGSQQKAMDIMFTLMKRLRLVKLEQLEFHLVLLTPVSGLLWSTETWTELLRGSPIQCIRLHEPGEAIVTFFYSLMVHMPFLPQLVDIWIISTNFQSPVVGMPFLNLVLSLLHQISSVAQSIEFELTIRKCSNISVNDITLLERLITVDWDEKDTARDDDDDDDYAPGFFDFGEDFQFSDEEGQDI